MFVAPIVEGHGEQGAIAPLLRRIGAELGIGTIRVNRPLRVRADRFLRDDTEFTRYVELAARKAKPELGCVLILLDADDVRPCELGPSILARAQDVRRDVPIVVALAHREYETWFLAAARSLRGFRGLPDDLEPPAIPTAIRDAKGWLSDRMGKPYDPVVDQVAFTSVFDLTEAKAAPSFDRLVRKLAEQFGSSAR